MKMTKAQEDKLNCICGGCEHTYLSKSCPYNKILEAKDPAEEQKKLFKALMREVLATNAKTTARATIKTKQKGTTCQKSRKTTKK